MTRYLRGRAVLASTAAALAGLLLAPVAAAEDADLAPVLRSPGANESSLRLTIPAGVLPTVLSGVVSTTSRVGGEVVLLVEGREVARLDASAASDPDDPAEVSVPLFAEDATDGVLEVALRRELAPTATGCPPLQPVTTELRGVRLDYLGEEPMPTSADDFFPPLTSRIDVQIPRTADDEVIQAGLRAVAALGAVYPAGTVIRLGSPGTVLPRTGLGQRIVQLSPTESEDGEDGEAATSVSDQFGIPKLELEGTGAQLDEAVASFGSALVVQGTPGGAGGPAGDEGSDGLLVRPTVRDPQAVVGLGDLGLGTLSLAGTGLASTEMAVPQDLFGGPLDQLDLHVEGTHDPLEPGVRAQLSAHVNGELVGSTVLDDSGEVSLDASVPGYRLRSANRLRLSLATVPGDDGCADPGTPLPVELDLDPAASTLSGITGSPLVGGLSTFPQVLGGDLRVAVRKQGQLRTAAAGDAARVVLALQHAAGAPLEVELVDPDELVDGGGTGLLVSAVEDDAEALSSPLGLGPFDEDDGEGGSFGIRPDDMYAVLETAGRPDQPVLLLGSWTTGRARETEPVVTALLDQVARDGWSSLDGTVLVVAEDAEPVSLDLAVLGPPPSDLDADDGQRAAPTAPWWLVPGIVLLALVLALQVVLHVRRERRLAAPREEEPEVSADPQPSSRA